ncbi:MAG: ATP-binding protein [Nitrospira sp.]|nr:ATP-binding protein [Nitrospira sp.]
MRSSNYCHRSQSNKHTVLYQLVVNARDAMPNGGRLTIEVKTIEDCTKSARPLPIESVSPRILIQITDTGIGMNLDTQAYMFEPLFSTKETNIGLGLAVVFGIVKRNGGTLEVDS